MAVKQRADLLLCQQGLAASRERARAAIMAGLVRANGKTVNKAGEFFDPDVTALTLLVPEHPYVGRGGLKLAKAITSFQLDLTDLILLDVGASTGGFTDCALQQGAAHVYALDVGYGQLAWKLRQDCRVTVIERTNIRTYTGEAIKEKVNGVMVDVSFISLTLVLPHLLQYLDDQGWVVALIKPQFEAGKDKVGKRGVVRDPEVHRQVIAKVFARAQTLGLVPCGLIYSPVTGADGNIEYLTLLAQPGFRPPAAMTEEQLKSVVDTAFATLGRAEGCQGRCQE